MNIRNSYLYHIKTFILFKGDSDITVELIEDYIKYLKTNFKLSSVIVKWFALKNYMLNESDWSIEKVIKELEWLNYKHINNIDRSCISAYKVNDYEFSKLLEIASEKIYLIMVAIRETNMRISELLNIKIGDDILSTELKKKCLAVFNGDKYVFVSNGIDFHGNKKRLRPAYVSGRIRVYGERALGKRVSAESLRR